MQYEAIICEAIPYEAIRDPWSNPPGIDRPEGGLKTQSPHKRQDTTHIYLPTALHITEYRLQYTRSTVHTCMLMGLTLKLASLATALVRSLLSRSAASPRLTPAPLALPPNLGPRLTLLPVASQVNAVLIFGERRVGVPIQSKLGNAAPYT